MGGEGHSHSAARTRGLNMMDWEDHAGTFQVEWITRYVAPGEAAWKTVLDSFLLYDKRGKNIYRGGRQILFMKLNMRQKRKCSTGCRVKRSTCEVV